MSLSRKFVIVLMISVCSIAIVNILAFYVFYNSYIRLYLSEKIDSRQNVTIEYINKIIERQTLEDIDNIFSDVELEFFELLDLSDGNIPLQEDKNVNIVIDYLVKS
jgi:capsular polysaccharide biosynthesis protein